MGFPKTDYSLRPRPPRVAKGIRRASSGHGPSIGLVMLDIFGFHLQGCAHPRRRSHMEHASSVMSHAFGLRSRNCCSPSSSSHSAVLAVVSLQIVVVAVVIAMATLLSLGVEALEKLLAMRPLPTVQHKIMLWVPRGATNSRVPMGATNSRDALLPEEAEAKCG